MLYPDSESRIYPLLCIGYPDIDPITVEYNMGRYGSDVVEAVMIRSGGTKGFRRMVEEKGVMKEKLDTRYFVKRVNGIPQIELDRQQVTFIQGLQEDILAHLRQLPDDVRKVIGI